MRIYQKTDRGEVRSVDMLTYVIIIVVLLHCYGFPGSYERVFGSILETAMKGLVFVGQLWVMIASSADAVLDVHLFDLRKKYLPIYIYTLTVFGISMLGTSFMKPQIVSCVNYALHVLFALWICEHISVEGILEIVLHSQVIFVGLSVLFPILFPGYYADANRVGVFLGCLGIKNVTAAQLSFGILMQTILMRVRLDKGREFERWFAPFYILQLVLLIMAQGVGSLFSTSIAIVYLLWFERRHPERKRLELGFLYIIGSVGFLLFAMTVVQMAAPLFEMVGKDATLSGRTLIWGQLINVMTYHKTLTGYGYCMFWEDPSALALFHAGFIGDDTLSWYAQMSAGAHNTIIGLWCEIGLMGVAVYFWMMLSTLKKPERWHEDQYVFISGFMLLFIMAGLTESAVSTFGYMMFFMNITLGVACNKMSDEEYELEMRERAQAQSTFI